MKVKLIFAPNNNKQPIGWTIEGETEKEKKKVNIIRDLQFWGIDDTVIKYNGRETIDNEENNAGRLSWKQKRFHKKQNDLFIQVESKELTNA